MRTTTATLAVVTIFVLSAAGGGAAAAPSALSPPADIWVMGVEVTQAFQDAVFVDTVRPVGRLGIVSVGGRSRGDALIAGKPAVVRVYLGLRQPVPPTGSVLATGSALIDMHDGGAPVVLQPLETIDCSVQIALPNQACRAVIRVFPPLGRQGLPTASDFDLDLIDGRTHWQGTLNFVLPASVTSRLAATGHLTLHLSANPVDATETVPGDNQFTLEHRVIAVVNPLRIRLARVQYKSSIPAPPPLTARLTLNNALRVLPYSEVKVVSDDEYRWDGKRIRIRLGPISFYKFSQCESLWIRLFQKFGLTENAVLVALTPRGLTLQGCVGLGGGVPGAGGIALSQTPDNDEDRERLAVLAQELYHALFQRSHVSTDHGEKHGCPLHGSEIAKLISILTRGRFDCAKRSPYPHGALGAYPATGATINGARGGMAVDILPFGTTWKLMLFDPCPTGSIRFNPLIALGRRWDTTTKKYRCLLDDSFVAHDFMSYGGHRWSSRAQFFGGPRLSLVTPTS